MNIKRLFSRLTALLLALVMLMGVGVVAVASEPTVEAQNIIDALNSGIGWDDLMIALDKMGEEACDIIDGILTEFTNDFDAEVGFTSDVLERIKALEDLYDELGESTDELKPEVKGGIENLFDEEIVVDVVGWVFATSKSETNEPILVFAVVSEEQKQTLPSELDSDNAVWMDISLFFNGGNKDNPEEAETELAFPLTMTMPIPSSMNQGFKLIHFSENYGALGYAEIPYTLDGGKFTFSVKWFSPFAFANPILKPETKQSETGTVQDNYYHFPFMLVPVEETPASPADTPSSWAKDAIDEARKLGLIPSGLDGSWRRWLSRAEFCALAVRLYEYLDGKEITERGYFTDTTDINVLKLAGLGIVKGDGEGRFNPDGYFTREMALTLMYNLLARLGYALADAEPVFSDAGSISPWARRAVGAMQNAGILQGDGSRFSPAEEYTREMGVVTVMQILWWVKP